MKSGKFLYQNIQPELATQKIGRLQGLPIRRCLSFRSMAHESFDFVGHTLIHEPRGMKRKGCAATNQCISPSARARKHKAPHPQ